MKFKVVSLCFLIGAGGLTARGFDDEEVFDLGDGPIRQSCTNAELLVPPFNTCKVIDILKEDFFLKTNPLNTRSLLDMPLFQPTSVSDGQWHIGLSTFFNKTDRSYFTDCNDDIASYLGLTSDPFISRIETAFKTIRTSICGDFFTETLGIPASVFSFNVREFLSFFSNMTVEERRAGGMLTVAKNHGRWFFGVSTPIYWVEHNLFLTQGEIERIEATQLFPEQTPDQRIEFASKHMISDRLGFGDTRCTIAASVAEKNGLDLRLGAQATIPTALSLQDGLYGSVFKSCVLPPNLDLCDILSIGLDPSSLKRRLVQDLDILSNRFIDRLSAMLIDTSLGNENHWGFGCFAQPVIQLNDWISLHSKLSIEHLIATEQLRFFLTPVNLDEFNKRDFSSMDEVVAEGNLRFLNARILDMFFPTPCLVTVQPGPIITFLNAATITNNNWQYNLGGDFWYQGKETIRVTNHLASFATEKVTRPAAYQLKAFGGISYTYPHQKTHWILSLNGDTTVFNAGIGKDYTVALKIGITW